MLSLLSIGGAIATVPDMHRYLVGEKQWLDDATFSSSIALAQAAPGPNLLFVPVLGFQVAGLAGAAVTMIGMLLPSTTLALLASRWMQKQRQAVGVRAFVAGMMPVTIGLLLATGWVLARSLHGNPSLVAMVVAATLLSWRTKIAPGLDGARGRGDRRLRLALSPAPRALRSGPARVVGGPPRRGTPPRRPRHSGSRRPQHRYAHELVAGLARQLAHARAFGAEHQGHRAAQVEVVEVHLGVVARADDAECRAPSARSSMRARLVTIR